MEDELSQLKAEVERLRQNLDHVLRVIGQEEELPEQPRAPFLLLEAEMISIRQTQDRIPMVIKAQDGSASVYLNDDEARARGIFQIDEEGRARLEIWNKKHQLVVSIGETNEGGGEIYVASPDGKPRAGMKASEFGGIVSAQNSSGQPNALLVGKDEGGTVVVADANGRPLAEIATTDEKGASLVFFDEQGNAKATLPGKRLWQKD